MKQNKLMVQDVAISFTKLNDEDYISLTDIARVKDSQRSDYILQNWMRNRATIEFLGLWEKINNDHFNSIEFDGIKNEAGVNSFVLTPKRWITSTNSIGIKSKAGRYGGTYAHKDIAFEFASWISAEFKLFLIKEFQRLKNEEIQKNHLEWDLKRNLAKVNYKIHTDAIKESLIPNVVTKKQSTIIYANEADLLNTALFGMTAKEWREANRDKDGNIRDYASAQQLVVLSNMESMNAELIKQELPQAARLKVLNEMAISQLKSIVKSTIIKKLDKQ